jgi:hypothetical protein
MLANLLAFAFGGSSNLFSIPFVLPTRMYEAYEFMCDKLCMRQNCPI